MGAPSPAKSDRTVQLCKVDPQAENQGEAEVDWYEEHQRAW